MSSYDPIYKEYKYKEVKEKIDKQICDVIYVEDHSKVDAIYYHWWDGNADDIRDGWANRHDWHFEFYVKYKDDEKWTKMPDEPWQLYKGLGIFRLLFALESDKVRNKIERQYRIKELKSIIKNSEKELEELTTK